MMNPVDPDRELRIERVLRCVEQIPEGRVAAYGVIGTVCGLGPREVGSIMRHYGSDVPWWRVTSHSGDLPAGLLARAADAWHHEGIAVKPNGLGCRYSEYGVDPDILAAKWRLATADLPAP